MWKLWTARRRWGLAPRLPSVVSSRGRRRTKTRGAPCTQVLLFAVFALTLGTLAAFCKAEQEPSPSAGRRVGVRSQPSIQAATAITQVDIRRSGQEAIVRVQGDGRLTVHTFRLNSPERLVLDFSGARLALANTSIRGALKPVHGVRVGQFKPDVARVVIDLEFVATYSLKSEGRSVAVTFALGVETSSTEPAASQTETEHAKPLVHVHRTETPQRAAMSPVAFDASRILRPELLREPTSALTSPVPSEATGEPSEDTFEDGMLSFHAQNQTLRSILDQIGDKAQIPITLAEHLGDERVSFELRHQRLDEALRQVLEEYDVLFLYGVDQQKKGPASLRAVWVYPATQGPGIDRSSLGSRKMGTKDVDRILVGPSPDVGAKAIEAPARREPTGGQSANPGADRLADQRDETRTQAYYKALISGAELPEQALIDLALNNESVNVRLLALQALPVEPRLRWVAERAVYDSGPVGDVARDILRRLDAGDAAQSPMGANQTKPQEK